MAHDSRFEKPTRRGRVDDSGGDADGGKKLYSEPSGGEVSLR
jgi:DNA polymerase-3 subunit alpha